LKVVATVGERVGGDVDDTEDMNSLVQRQDRASSNRKGETGTRWCEGRHDDPDDAFRSVLNGGKRALRCGTA
jgi:hypothetical protein